MKTLMIRFPSWLAVSNASSMDLKNLRVALAAAAVIAITAVGANAAPAAGQRTINAGPAGHWEADITGDGAQRIRVSLDLAKNAKSEWIGSMGLPSDNKTGLVVKDVVVNGKSVKFVALELMSARFELTLGPDGNMKGTISGPGSQPVDFKRTGEAKVELMPNSPAVSKELEGDWEGSLGSPNGGFRMVFHFKNQPDKTVMTTFDTANATNLPLNDVKQKGQKVEFGMRIAHGTFQGTLNKEGTELSGQFTHEESSAPLTLRKMAGQPTK
jgi:hypothetical protein